MDLKCEQCNFACFWNFSLQSHVRRNHQVLKMGVFSCNLYPDWDCDTRLNYRLRRGHDWDNPEEQWKCPDCNFKTYSIFLVQAAHNCTEDTQEVFIKLEPIIKVFVMNEDLQKIKKEIDLESCKDKWLDCDNSCSKSGGSSSAFTCKQCPFKTKNKSNFRLHILRKHTPEDKIKWLICAQCPYKAKDKYSLSKHKLYKHKSSAEIKWFMCAQCPYKAKEKHSLSKHKLYKHKSSADIKWFMCEQCPYKTKSKVVLNEHILRKHTPEENIKWFNCAQCPYKAKEIRSLSRHKLYKHQSSREMCVCQECDHKALNKSNLKVHILRKHTPEDQIKWFICQKCPYRAKVKSSLDRHKACIHKSSAK